MNSDARLELTDIDARILTAKRERDAITLNNNTIGAPSQRQLDANRRFNELTRELVALDNRRAALHRSGAASPSVTPLGGSASSSSSTTPTGSTTYFSASTEDMRRLYLAELQLVRELQTENAELSNQKGRCEHEVAVLTAEIANLRARSSAFGVPAVAEIEQLRVQLRTRETELARLQAVIVGLRGEVELRSRLRDTAERNTATMREQLAVETRRAQEETRKRVAVEESLYRERRQMEERHSLEIANLRRRLTETSAASTGSQDAARVAELTAELNRLTAEHDGALQRARATEETLRRESEAAAQREREERLRNERDTVAHHAAHASADVARQNAEQAAMEERLRRTPATVDRLGEAAAAARRANEAVNAADNRELLDRERLAMASVDAARAATRAEGAAAATVAAAADDAETRRLAQEIIDTQAGGTGVLGAVRGAFGAAFNLFGGGGAPVVLPPPPTPMLSAVTSMDEEAELRRATQQAAMLPVASGKQLELRLFSGDEPDNRVSFKWYKGTAAGTESSRTKNFAQALLYGDKSVDVNDAGNRPLYSAEKHGIAYDANKKAFTFYATGASMVALVEMILKPVLSYYYEARFVNRGDDHTVLAETVMPLLWLIIDALDQELLSEGSSGEWKAQLDAAWEFMRNVTQWLFIKLLTKNELARDDRDAFREQTDAARNVVIGNNLIYTDMENGIGQFTDLNEADKGGRRNTVRAREPATGIVLPPMLGALNDGGNTTVAKNRAEQIYLLASMQLTDDRFNRVFEQNTDIAINNVRRDNAQALSRAYRTRRFALDNVTKKRPMANLFGSGVVEYAPVGTPNERVLMISLFQRFYPDVTLLQAPPDFLISRHAIFTKIFETLVTTPGNRGEPVFTELPANLNEAAGLPEYAAVIGPRRSSDVRNLELDLEIVRGAGANMTRTNDSRLAIAYLAAEFGVAARKVRGGIRVPTLKLLTAVAAYAVFVPYTLNAADREPRTRYIERFGVRPQYVLPLNAPAELKAQLTVKSAARTPKRSMSARDLREAERLERLVNEDAYSFMPAIDAFELLAREGRIDVRPTEAERLLDRLREHRRNVAIRGPTALSEVRPGASLAERDAEERLRIVADSRLPGETTEETLVRLAREGRLPYEEPYGLRQRVALRNTTFDDAARLRLLQLNRMPNETLELTRRRLIEEGRWLPDIDENTRRQLLADARRDVETPDETRIRLLREGRIGMPMRDDEVRRIVNAQRMPIETEEETRRRLVREGRLPLESEDETFRRLLLEGALYPGALGRMPGDAPAYMTLSTGGRAKMMNESDEEYRLRLIGEGRLTGETPEETRLRLIGEGPKFGESVYQWRLRMIGKGMLPGQTMEELGMRPLGTGILPGEPVVDNRALRLLAAGSTRQPMESEEEYRMRLISGAGGREPGESEEQFRARLLSRYRPGVEDEATQRRRIIDANRAGSEMSEQTEARLVLEKRLPLETMEQTRVRLAREGEALGESAEETRRRLARESFLSPETLLPARRSLVTRGLLPDETPEETRLRLISQGALPIETNEEAFLRRGSTIRLADESEEDVLLRLRKKDALEREGLLPGESYDDARRRIARDQLLPGETQGEMRERLTREGRVPAEGLLPGETLEDARRRFANQGLLVDADAADMMLSQAFYDRARRMSAVIRGDKRYPTISKWVAAADKPVGNTGERTLKETTFELIDRSTKEPLTVLIPNNLLWSYIVEGLRARGGVAKFGSLGRVASFFVVRGRADLGSKTFGLNRVHTFESINGVDDLNLYKDSNDVVRIEGSSPLKLVPYGRTTFARSVQFESDATRNGIYYVLEPFGNTSVVAPLPRPLGEPVGSTGMLPPPIAADARAEGEEEEYFNAESEARNRSRGGGGGGGRRSRSTANRQTTVSRANRKVTVDDSVVATKNSTHNREADEDVRALQHVLVANRLERALFARPSGSYTIFAPTADVFERAMVDLEAMSVHERRQLLKYHILRGDFDAAKVKEFFRREASEMTLDDSQRLIFAPGEPGSYVGRIYLSDLTSTDRMLFNKRGERHFVRVHFIRRLLAPRDMPFLTILSERNGYAAHGVPQVGPPGTRKPGTFANPTIGAERRKGSIKYSGVKHDAKHEDLLNMYTLLREADLTNLVFGSGNRRYTVFVPTSSAFGMIEQRFNALEYGEQKQLLEYHVLEGDYTGDAVEQLFERRAKLPMLSADTLKFDSGTRPRGEESRGCLYSDEIVAKDLEIVDSQRTQNRVRVHLISIVLMPKGEDDDDDDDDHDEEGDDNGDEYDENDEGELTEGASMLAALGRYVRGSAERRGKSGRFVSNEHRGKKGRYKRSSAKNKSADLAPVASAVAADVDMSNVALSTASKASFGVTPIEKIDDAVAHHEKLVRTLQGASSADEAAKAVQTFAATVSSKARATASDEAWGDMIHKAREALAVNNRLQPAEKKAAHGELTSLQQK